MKKLFFALSFMLFGFASFAQNTATLLNNYLAVKNALVSGDAKAATQAISTFEQGIKAEGNFAQKDALMKATENMAKANGIDKQRAAFNDVSASVWKVVKGADKVAQPVYYQYCPMKKAYWVSKDKDIKNPYYGSSMLTCGKTVETKN